MPLLQGTNNVLLTDDAIAAEALRLLVNELAAVRRVHRGQESKFGGSPEAGHKIGDQISIKKPFRTLVGSGRTLSVQPMIDETVTLTVDQQRNIGLRLYQDQKTLSLTEFSNRYLKSAITALAHKVDRWVLDQIQDAGFYGSGTPGTAIDDDAFNDAIAYMEMVGVPVGDGMLSAFLNPLDASSIAKNLKTYNNEAMVKRAVNQNYIGEHLSGFKMFKTAQVPVHAVAAHGGTPLVNGGSQTGTSLVTDGWPNSTLVLNAGDTFTLANVYEVNPQTYESTGRLQRFTVTAAGTSSGTGTLTISISPGINDGTNTTVDADGNNVSLAAYQNVDAGPADNAAITVIGTASTSYREALCFHRDAFSFACVPIELPKSAVVKSRVTDPKTGISILMTGEWDGTNFRETHRLDVLFGGKAVYPELIHRIKSA